ncbi:response regulator [Patescibacteria group bacterium]|nr:response regulator [Patescibacteria group bacterium]
MEQSTKNKTILVVEDERAMLQILADRFTDEGFSVLEAKNGEEGLERAIKEHPDLILLDIILPKMNGITMLKKLRVDNWGKDVPVIILTNLSDMGTIAKALKDGVYDFLVKTDWKLEDIVKKVKEKLEFK